MTNTNTTARLRDANGRFLPAKPVTKAKAKVKAKTPVKRTVKAKAPTKKAIAEANRVEREAARAERIDTLANGLTVSQARAALIRAQRELATIQATRRPGYVKAASRVSTATKVVAVVEARQSATKRVREQQAQRSTPVKAKRQAKRLVNA